MQKQYRISIYLDARAKKKNGLYSLKIRAHSYNEGKSKFFPTNIDLPLGDYRKMFNIELEKEKPILKPDKRKQLLRQINEIENKADKIASELDPFTLNLFGEKFLIKKKARINVYRHYEDRIKFFKSQNKIGTSISYTTAIKSFESYHKNIESLTFYDITPKWLAGYQAYMLEQEKSYTTISMYLKTLMAIFNNAIAEKDIKASIYPFGKNKYQAPESTSKKRALTQQQIKILFNAKPKTSKEEIAKSFWFFSYACNGMNMKDIALLKRKDIENDIIRYYRAKTLNTSKKKKEIKIFLNSYAKNVIDKYGKGDEYVFTVVNSKDSATEKHRKIKHFVSFVNRHTNNLAKDAGFDFRISTYWARHSFATLAIRNGASMEFVSEALNHKDMTVTKVYFDGFEDETKKEFANKLMEF